MRPRPGIFEALSAKVKTTPKKGSGKEQMLAPEKVDLEKSLLIPVKVQYNSVMSKENFRQVGVNDLMAEYLDEDEE